jgi:ribosomal protein L6P/L9E
LSVSSTVGWGLNVLKKVDLFPQIFNSLLLSKPSTSLFNNFKMGLCKIFLYVLKLKGMGFKMLVHDKGIIFKLGYSHRILFLSQKEISREDKNS